ncbi:T9SS type A sorting domain-containing protein, partial [Chitinophagales bacterium]|nr:T9SS type A sorting domain-containing protein [Chitinophagales bacterium]
PLTVGPYTIEGTIEHYDLPAYYIESFSFEIAIEECITLCNDITNLELIAELASTVEGDVNLFPYQDDGFIVGQCGAGVWNVVDCEGVEICAFYEIEGSTLCSDLAIELPENPYLVYSDCLEYWSADLCSEQLDYFDVPWPGFEFLWEVVIGPVNGVLDESLFQSNGVMGYEANDGFIGTEVILLGKFSPIGGDPMGVYSSYLEITINADQVDCFELDCTEQVANEVLATIATDMAPRNIYAYPFINDVYYVVSSCGINAPSRLYNCNGTLLCTFINEEDLNTCVSIGILTPQSLDLVYSDCSETAEYSYCDEDGEDAVEFTIPHPGFEYFWSVIDYPTSGEILGLDENVLGGGGMLSFIPENGFSGTVELVIGNASPLFDEIPGYYGEFLTIVFNVNTEDCGQADCNGVIGGSAVIDLCGICLDPLDPNFNGCLVESEWELCDSDSLTVEYSEAFIIPNGALLISVQPQNGNAYTEVSPNGGSRVVYHPFNGYQGDDFLVVTYYSFLPQIEWTEVVYLNVTDCDDEDVWAGDVNYDGIANNIDVIYIGMQYEEEGPNRPNASIIWEAQPAASWNDVQANGSDVKHADCDGNGVVDLGDKFAILSNYNQEHVIGKGAGDENDPPLELVAPPFASPGQLITVPIALGSELIPIENVYGVAFTIEFDADFVEPESMIVNFSESWLGAEDVEQTGFYKVLNESNTIDIAATRLNKMNASGYGIIGTLSYVMADDIIGKGGASIPFNMSITQAIALSLENEELDIYAIGSQTEVNTGIGEFNSIEGSIYPVPAQDYIVLDFPTIKPSSSVTVYTASGAQIVLEDVLIAGKQRINTSALPDGLYFIEIITDEGRAVKKLEIIR